MGELVASLSDAIESCKGAIAAVDTLIASLDRALESCKFALTATVAEYNAVQQGIVGSNIALNSAMENLRHTYEPIETLIAAIESCEAAFANVEVEYNATHQVTAVGPNLALHIANLHHTYRHFELVRNNMKHFMIIAGMLLAFNAKPVIEDHDTAEPAPVGPIVDDESEEELNTAAPKESADHSTMEMDHKWDLPDFDQIMRHLMMITLNADAVDPTAQLNRDLPELDRTLN